MGVLCELEPHIKTPLFYRLVRHPMDTRKGLIFFLVDAGKLEF